MSLLELPAEWRRWIEENVERGCTPDTMLPRLLDGGFDPTLAQTALDEAQRGRLPARALRPAPRLDGGNTIDCDGHPVRLLSVLDQPLVVHLGGMLSVAECDALVALAGSRMAPSTVVDDQRGMAVPHADRTSAGAYFQRSEFALLATLESRIAALLDWPADRGEGVQVLRYAPGGQYKAHFDYFDPAKPGSATHLAQGGQRVGTVVMYLCDVEAGGSTRFPSLGLEVRPSKGDAVFFADVDAGGRVDPRTLHAGSPVLRGTKIIATKWLRQTTYGAA